MKRFDSINTVPFIDVLLVLLCIVLLTSSFIATGEIAVSLPESKSSNLIEKSELHIYIKQSGELVFQDESVTFEELKSRVMEQNKESLVHLYSDKMGSFGGFVEVLELLKSNSFENIYIVTKK